MLVSGIRTVKSAQQKVSPLETAPLNAGSSSAMDGQAAPDAASFARVWPRARRTSDARSFAWRRSATFPPACSNARSRRIARSTSDQEVRPVVSAATESSSPKPARVSLVGSGGTEERESPAIPLLSSTLRERFSGTAITRANSPDFDAENSNKLCKAREDAKTEPTKMGGFYFLPALLFFYTVIRSVTFRLLRYDCSTQFLLALDSQRNSAAPRTG